MLPPREIFKPEKETTMSKGPPLQSTLAPEFIFPSRIANPRMQALRNQTTTPVSRTNQTVGRKDSCILRIED